MLIKGFYFLLLISLTLSPTLSTLTFAHEPTNLAIAKQKIKRYHDSGAYQKDIANIIQKAMRYLELRVQQGNFNGLKPAIVLDIDETALTNYPDLVKRDFGGTKEEIQQDEDQGTDDVILPTLKLFRFAKENHIAVFFITGRYEPERQTTEQNLQKVGFIHYDGLILRTTPYYHVSAAIYKKAARKQLSEQGYDIILNIGDQQSDLVGGYADKTFKLPNPYYYTP